MRCRLKQSFSTTAALILTLVGCGDTTAPDSPAEKRTNNSQTVEEKTNSPKAFKAAKSQTRGELFFTSVLEESGITFRHTSGNSKEKAFPAANGSGLAAFDADLDGYVDLYFGSGTDFPINPERDGPFDEFYRNVGDWKFRNVTTLAGFRNPDYTTGIECGDFNSDGFPDVYVTSVGKNQLYSNLGDGTFAEVSVSTGTDDGRWATGAAFFDMDNDGLLDLYVCNYGQWSLETNQFCGDQSRGIRMFCSPTIIPPEDDVLLRNMGDGSFADLSESSGIRVRRGRGQSVIATDLNGDLKTDLYVSNDINQNFLFLNDGKGHFTEAGEASGAAFDHLGQAQAGMGLAAGDVNRDGNIDLFVTNYQNEHNAFYENLGKGVFLETGITRIPEGSVPFVGWGTALEDFDLDGWLDLIVTNGHTDDNLADLGKEGVYLQPPGLWKNRQGRLELAGDEAGSYFQSLHNGRGLCVADLDNDGDFDVVIGHQDDYPELLRNDSVVLPSPQMIWLKLSDSAGNRDSIGTVVTTPGLKPPSSRTVFGGGSYASARDRRLIIAVPSEEPATLELQWTDGIRSSVHGLKSGQGYAIVRPPNAEKDVRAIPIMNP